MKKSHYAWIICAVCTLLMFGTIGLTATGFLVHQPYLLSVGNLNNSQSSLIITLRISSSLLSILLCQKLYSHIGIRSGVTLAAVTGALSFFIFSVANSPGLYFFAAILAGLSFGFGGSIPVSILIDRWFYEHKALALGICFAGTGLAAVLVPPVITLIIEAYSWKTSFLIEMVFLLLIAVAAYTFLRNEPEECNLKPLGNKSTGIVPQKETAHSKNRSATIRLTIAMCIAVTMIGAIGNVSYAHLSVLFSVSGFSSSTISIFLSVVGLSLGLGKIIFGGITDKIGVSVSALLFFSLLTLGEISCCFASSGNVIFAIIGLVLLGLGLSLSSVGLSVFAYVFSSGENYTKTIKLFQITFQVGSLVFGLLPGLIADHFHSYIPFYLLMVGFSVLSGIITITCIKLQTRNANTLIKSLSAKNNIN